MLNKLGPVEVGRAAAIDAQSIRALEDAFDESPSGGTPLCRHIHDVVSRIQGMAAGLYSSGQKVSLVIATDGESSDGDLAAAMKPLEQLPVNVVVRLCTDSEQVVNYWNSIDSQLELQLEVLDDLFGEAKEIAKTNPWLTYTDAIQQLRILGSPIKELDLLDEAPMTLDQLRAVVAVVLGGGKRAYPDPAVDPAGFAAAVQAAVAGYPQVFSPNAMALRPCLDLAAMAHVYHTGGAPAKVPVVPGPSADGSLPYKPYDHHHHHKGCVIA
jgi:hypothetical protein